MNGNFAPQDWGRPTRKSKSQRSSLRLFRSPARVQQRCCNSSRHSAVTWNPSLRSGFLGYLAKISCAGSGPRNVRPRTSAAQLASCTTSAAKLDELSAPPKPRAALKVCALKTSLLETVTSATTPITSCRDTVICRKHAHVHCPMPPMRGAAETSMFDVTACRHTSPESEETSCIVGFNRQRLEARSRLEAACQTDWASCTIQPGKVEQTFLASSSCCD